MKSRAVALLRLVSLLLTLFSSICPAHVCCRLGVQEADSCVGTAT